MTEKEDTLRGILTKMDENRKLLREIVRWSRFQNMGRLKDILVAELDSDEKKLAFENTDGMKGIKEIALASGAPQDTVYSWWKKWSRLGILEPSESREGRLAKICSLEDMGIKIPKIASPKDKTSETKEAVPEKAAESGTSMEKTG